MVRTLAGYDSTIMKDIVPTIMLFVPSVEGISHNERELTSDEDMLAGVDLLTELLGRVVQGEFVAPCTTLGVQPEDAPRIPVQLTAVSNELHK